MDVKAISSDTLKHSARLLRHRFTPEVSIRHHNFDTMKAEASEGVRCQRIHAPHRNTLSLL
jgi:hypothetical protein